MAPQDDATYHKSSAKEFKCKKNHTNSIVKHIFITLNSLHRLHIIYEMFYKHSEWYYGFKKFK